MSIFAYLNFKGNCWEAVEFYTEVFGVAEKPKIMSFGDMPPNPEHPICQFACTCEKYDSRFPRTNEIRYE